MAEYSSWKVTDLKAELKRRGIPQTGLRLKQQIIEKLLEADGTEPEVAQGQEQGQGQKQEQKGASETQEKPEPKAPIEEAAKEADVEPPAVGPTAGSQSQDVTTATAKDDAPGLVPTNTVVASITEQIPAPDEAPENPPLPQNPPSPENPPSPKATEQSPETAGALMEQDTIPSQSSQDAPPQLTSPEATSAGGDSIALPELSREDSVNDLKKRKRRSQSPPPSPRTIALKRAKAENGKPRDVVTEEVPMSEAPKVEVAGAPQDTDVEMSTEEQAERPTSPQYKIEKDADKEIEQEMHHPDQEIQEEEHMGKAEEGHAARRSAGDARFKGLFPPTNGEQLRHEPSHAEDEDRMVAPALHPATTSLYIRDFMRPLQPATVKTHLASLAAPPGSSPDPDVILTFFLDSIKTHCFVTFATVAAASRVRTALHDTIWPEERSRKPLWVDFIPEEKVQDWIDTEQGSGNGGRGAPRWEVLYEDTEDGFTAILREAIPPHMQRGSCDMPPPPTGPRADRDVPQGGGPSHEIPEHGFKALDDRFRSTDAKPKLYYLPVSREVADKRLDRFDNLARAGPIDKRGGDEMRKYTFEDTDFFVDKGPEFGRRNGGGGRGGRGGRGRFHDNIGGSWRGRR